MKLSLVALASLGFVSLTFFQGCGVIAPKDLGEEDVAASTPQSYTSSQCSSVKSELLGKTSDPFAKTALENACRAYKAGQTRRCADFVSTMIIRSKTEAQGFYFTELAANFAKMGSKVSLQELQPGDIVLFKNTYSGAPVPAYTHVGIYVGDGHMVHRPTSYRDVEVEPIMSGYWRSHFTEARRLTRELSWNKSPLKKISFKPEFRTSVLKSDTNQSNNHNIKCVLHLVNPFLARVSKVAAGHWKVRLEETIEGADGAQCQKGTVGYLYSYHFDAT